MINKTHRDAEDFIEIDRTLKETINFTHVNYYKDKLPEAMNLAFDKDDIDYFALALKLGCCIWSNDKKMKEQDKVIVYSTKELVDEFKLG